MSQNLLADKDLEESLLSAIIHNPSCLPEVLTKENSPKLMKDEQNREIWRSIIEMHEEDKPIDPTAIVGHVTAQNYLNKNQAKTRLGRIVRLQENEDHAEGWAKMLVDKLERRSINRLSSDLRSMSKDPDLDTEEIRKYAADELARSQRTNEPERMSEVAAGALERMKNEDVGEFENDVIRTGMPELDERLEEVEKDDFVGICARPGVGKTSFTIQLAGQQKLIYDNVVIDIFSLEMSVERLTMRMVSQLTGVPYSLVKQAVRMRGVNEDVKKAVMKGYETVLSWRDSGGIRVYSGSFTSDEVCQIVHGNAMKAQNSDNKRYLCAYLDNFQALSEQPRLEQKEESSNKLKGTTLEAGVPIFSIFHLNRDSVKQNRPPEVRDIKGCGQVEQDLDRAIMLDRPDQRNDFLSEEELMEMGIKPGWATIDVRKNREGATGYFEKYFHGPTMQFLDSEKQSSNFKVSSNESSTEDKQEDEKIADLFSN